MALDRKVTLLSRMFESPEQPIIPMSGTGGYNLELLAKKIVRRLSPDLVCHDGQGGLDIGQSDLA